MAIAETAELIARLQLKNELSGEVRRAKGDIASLGQTVSQQSSRIGQTTSAMGRHVGQGLSTAGRNLERLAVAGGATLVGLGVGAAKLAMDWEDAFAGVRKTVEATEPEFAVMEKGILGLSGKIPIAATELAGLAEAAGALGVRKQDILEFTRVTALMGVTTDVTAQAAAESFGKIGTVIGLTGDEYERFASTVVALGNDGASTEQAILGITQRIAGAGKTVGIAKDQLAGWGSAASNIGMQTEAAGSNLSTFFITMFKHVSNGGEGLEAIARTAGMTGQQFRKAFKEDASGALATFVEGLGELKAEDRLGVMSQLSLTGVRMNTLLLGLTSNTENLRRALGLSREEWKRSAAMQEEAEKRFKTTASGLALLKNNLRLVGITIGSEFLPQIAELAREGVGWLQENPEKIKQLAKEMGDGFRSLVKWAKEVDWQALAGALRTAASMGKSLMDAFVGAPDWLKGAIVTGWGLNKLTGGMVGNLFGDVLKGVTGGATKAVMNNIPGLNKMVAQPVVVTNWPAGGMGPGAGAGAAGGGGVMSRIGGAVRVLGAVSIAGGSIMALGEEFGKFQNTVAEAQASLQEKADAARDQTAEQALSNLRQMNRKLNDVQGLDRILGDTFGGEQIADGLQNLSRSVAQNGRLNADQVTEAIGVLEEAQRQAIARGNQKVADSIGQDITTLRNRQVTATRESTARLARELGVDITQLRRAQSVIGKETGGLLDRLRTSIRSPLERSADSLQTIKNQPTKISVTVPVTTSVSVRDVQTSTRTSSRYGFQAV